MLMHFQNFSPSEASDFCPGLPTRSFRLELSWVWLLRYIRAQLTGG